MPAVNVKNYQAPPFDRNEILRYAGARSPSPEIENLLDECLNLVRGETAYRVCFTQAPVTREGDTVNIGFIKTNSKNLAKRLENCDSAVVFAATLGIKLDRLILKYGAAAPSKALMLQAIGAERIESLCNLFEAEIAQKSEERNRKIAPRFSPGYGDLPIFLQKDIFLMLDCPKSIGLTLNDSMLMSPSKSVTAIIGLKNA